MPFKLPGYLTRIACCILICTLPMLLYAQNDDDISSAAYYGKKFKDEDIMCMSSYRYFTFDKGKNSLNDKVVTIEENAEYEFLSLKKYTSMSFPEFYNKFIVLKSFKRADKYGNKYILVDKSGVDRSVTGDDIFFDDSRVRFFPIRFNQAGSMSRVVVKKEYTDGKYLTRLFFHTAYPVKEQVFEFKVPDWLTVEFKRMNFDGQKVEVKETKKGGYTNYVFIMKDIPAYKSEYSGIGRAFTDPHIVVVIKSFEQKGETLQGFDKVDDVYQWNNRLYQMAGNKNETVKSLVTKLTQGKTNDIDKVKSMYYWIQDNIRYIAYEDGYSGYIPTPAQDVLAKKYGDCKGMANLLTEMLKTAGYDAHFSWVGTRSIPYPQSLPALCVNNHAISTLYLNNKTYFLDGTEKYGPFDENAYRIQGKEVMVSEGSAFKIQPVAMGTPEQNNILTKADFTLANDKLNGKVKVVLTGTQRTGFHQYYHDLASSKQKDYINAFLEFGNDNIVASNVKTSDLNNRETNISIEGNIDLSNTVQVISGDYYAGIDFFPKSLESYIPDEKRIGGYDLDELISFTDEISLTIPADKKFIDKPDDLTITNDGYTFKGTYVVTGNKIVLRKELTIRNSIIKKEDFANWTKFIDSIKEFNKYLISITKK